MSIEMIITLSVFGVFILGFIGVLIYCWFKKDLKQFVEAKMAEAEKTGKSGSEKLKYVLDAVKEKYKFNLVVKAANALVEAIIAITKQINYKK